MRACQISYSVCFLNHIKILKNRIFWNFDFFFKKSSFSSWSFRDIHVERIKVCFSVLFQWLAIIINLWIHSIFLSDFRICPISVHRIFFASFRQKVIRSCFWVNFYLFFRLGIVVWQFFKVKTEFLTKNEKMFFCWKTDSQGKLSSNL